VGESEISVRPGERRKSNALTVRISVVFAKWTFSDFAGAVPNLKPVEFGFPFLEKGFAFLDRLFVRVDIEKFYASDMPVSHEIAAHMFALPDLPGGVRVLFETEIADCSQSPQAAIGQH